MIKKVIFAWAIKALKEHIDDNGTELISQIFAWIESLVESKTGGAGVAASAPVGCEEWCDKKCAELDALLAEGE